MMIRNPRMLKETFASCNEELRALGDRSELSSYLNVNQLLSKSFLLSCASFYEYEIVTVVRKVVQSGTFYSPVIEWLDKAAVDGQFYKWFNFRSAKNTNTFLATFGREFTDNVRSVIDHRD